jgi:acetylornithine deacetylase
VPFSTLQTSIIQGGIAVNTVPADCEFSFEYRNLPTVDTAPVIGRIKDFALNTLLPMMKSEHPSAAIDFDLLASAPTLDASEQAAITQLVRSLTHDRATRKVAYGTEAGLFQAMGIPSVLCGPGNIEQAHKANEYVTLEQLALCEDFMRKLLVSLQLPG